MTALPVPSDETLTQILRSVKRIALFGASDKEDRPSFRVMKYLLDKGYDVIPVNPRLAGQKIHGRTVVSGMADIQGSVDMIDLFMNSAAVESMAEELINAPVKVLWMQIGVISLPVHDAAIKAGKQVVMNLCPKQEIPRLGL